MQNFIPEEGYLCEEIRTEEQTARKHFCKKESVTSLNSELNKSQQFHSFAKKEDTFKGIQLTLHDN